MMSFVTWVQVLVDQGHGFTRDKWNRFFICPTTRESCLNQMKKKLVDALLVDELQGRIFAFEAGTDQGILWRICGVPAAPALLLIINDCRIHLLVYCIIKKKRIKNQESVFLVKSDANFETLTRLRIGCELKLVRFAFHAIDSEIFNSYECVLI